MRKAWRRLAVGLQAIVVASWWTPPVVACHDAAHVIKEQTADWCLSYQGCVWDQTAQRCFVKQGTLFPEHHRIYERAVYRIIPKQGVLQFSAAGDLLRQGIGSQCPIEVMDYVGRYNYSVIHDNAVHGIESATDYANWASLDSWPTAAQPNSRERKIRLRTAWLALRKEGSCRKWVETGANGPPAKLKLTNEALHNWSLAKRGNAFNGVINCKTWEVSIIPQQPRNSVFGLPPIQLSWTTDQLKKIRFGKQTPTTPKYDIGQDKNVDHGTVALMAEGQSLVAPVTFTGWCLQEREIKGSYLGFSVWPDINTGALTLKYTSRQLNGPNLDRYRLTHPDDHGNYTANSDLIDVQNNAVYAANGAFIDNPADPEDSLLAQRGNLEINVAVALKKAMDELSLPKK